MTTAGIGPISDYDAWKLANPDDDGEREVGDVNEEDGRMPYEDKADELYQRWKEDGE